MGKLQRQGLPVQNSDGVVSSRSFFCQRCSMLLSRIFSFKCLLFLVLSIALFLSAVFWILPQHSHPSGFDAVESIKLAATAQASFRLEKPVSDIVPHITRLEYDILDELAIPGTKVAILSVHGAAAANQTNVTIGFRPDPVDTSFDLVYLSLLKSALSDLYLQYAKLALTSSIFGLPSSFEVLKCPDGITVIPEEVRRAWVPEVFFNFTLHSSIDEIRGKFSELKEQLTFGLSLRRNEELILQVTNKIGSTKDPPVIVEASLSGITQFQRLQQLAQIIMKSVPGTNLGLDYSVFGKVKQISLSSFLNRTVIAAPPTLPPAPSPAPTSNEPLQPSPSPSPTISPSPSPSPLSNCPSQDLNPGKEPSSSPSPIADPPSPVPNSGPRSSSSGIAASPSAEAPAYPPQVFSSISSSSSRAPGFSYKERCLIWLFVLTVLHILT